MGDSLRSFELNRLGISSPGGHRLINLTRHESEWKETSDVQVLLIDSDSDIESNCRPAVVNSTPILESYNVLNRRPKFLLNYSIPISDSESESEQSNKVNGTSNQVKIALAGSDDFNSLVTNNGKAVTLDNGKARRELSEEVLISSQKVEKISHKYKKTKDTSKNSSNACLEQNQSKSFIKSSVVILDDCKVREELSKGGSLIIQEIKKISHKYKKTKDTSNNSSNNCIEQNKSKSFNKSSLKNGKEKLDKSSHLVELNDFSNGHNAVEDVCKKVKGTSVKPSSQVTVIAGSDGHNSLITNNSKVVTLDDGKVGKELSEEGSFSCQEVEKISHKHKKTKDTSKNSSNTCLEQNQSKSFNKSSLKNGKEKLDRSSHSVEINNLSNGHNAIEDVRKRKNIVDGSTSCNSLITNNGKVVILDDCKVREELSKEGSRISKEIKKISHKYKKTKDTCNNSSNNCIEQNKSKSFNKSSLKNSKEKLVKSTHLVELNKFSNGHNAVEDVCKRKIIVDESTSCNGKESALESTLGQTNKTIQSTKKSINNLSSKNDKKSSKNESNQLKKMLIKDLLSRTEKSFSEQNVLSDQEIKKSKTRKRKSEKVNSNESNAATPPKTSKLGGIPANQIVPSEESSLPVADVTLEDTNNFQEHLFSRMTKALVCAMCRSWVGSSQVHFCECKLICTACSRSTNHCEDCRLDFAENKGFSKFHERLLLQLIDRPCAYQAAGCTSAVKPDDDHESSCAFKPFFCFKCNMEVPNVTVGQHFESEHHLTGKNFDVKIRDFYLNPISGKLEVCCLPSRKQQLVYLILNKCEEGENAQFLVNSGFDNDVNVKLLFTKKNSVFRYECDNKISNNNDQVMFDGSGLTFIDVSKEAINYWCRDECILNISFRSRVKKRKDEKKSSQDQIGDSEKFNEPNVFLENQTISENKNRRWSEKSNKQSDVLEKHTGSEKKKRRSQ